MPFSGLSTHAMYTAGPLNGEDVARQIALLAPDETPLLDWLGDPDSFAIDTKHDFLEEELRPNYLTTSTAINSATAATGIQLADFGDLLTVGTILENESASPEIMQVSSVVGQNSVLVTRAFGGGAVGSLAPGLQLFVRGNYALEGADHPGGDVTRKRRRKTTYLGLFHTPVAISGSQDRSMPLGDGGDEFEHQTTLRLREALRDLEKEVIRGILSGNSIGSSTAYRTFEGLRSAISSINSTVTASSFAANPHLYLGNVWEQAFQNGAAEAETWGVVAGRTYFRNISDMNDTKVQDTNQSERFKRVIRNYQGPFGNATVFLSRWMPATAALIIPRERVKVVPKQGRSFHVQDIAKTGDNRKRLIVGEYGVEVHHAQAMAQVKS
jgi:hypothetical protein